MAVGDGLSKVGTVVSVVDGIQDDLDNVTDGLGALKALIDANQVDLNAILVNTNKTVGGEYTGTVSAGTSGETTLKEIAGTSRVRIESIWIDATLLVTAGATIKLYHKIDGTTYRVFETASWALTDDDGILITGFTINNDFKVTLTGGEGAGVNIPYNIIYTLME